MAKTKKEEVINEETVDLNEVLDLEVKLEKPQLDLKDAMLNPLHHKGLNVLVGIRTQNKTFVESCDNPFHYQN